MFFVSSWNLKKNVIETVVHFPFFGPFTTRLSRTRPVDNTPSQITLILFRMFLQNVFGQWFRIKMFRFTNRTIIDFSFGMHSFNMFHPQKHGGKCLIPDQESKSSRTMCPICKKSFNSIAGMMNHYTSEHPEGKVYDCSVCDKKYLTLEG
jgi:hypothetical protein